MKLYGQLENAQLENKASDYSGGPVGRIWWNTATTKAKLDDGTNIRALLRNDQFCVVGNSATASQNIRLQRGATAVLQFVTGDDATAEGSLSTSLAQTSSRIENYATGSLPAAANAGRLLWDTSLSIPKVDNGSAIKQILLADASQVVTAKDIDGGTASNTSRITLPKNATATLNGLDRKEGTLVYDTDTDSVKYDDGTNLVELASSTSTPVGPYDRINYTLTATVAANALTVALKTLAGSDPSAGDPVTISFRNATLATGTFESVAATAATSVVVSSGSTLGQTSAVAEYVYVYAINNAGTIELAVSTSKIRDEGERHSTTAEGGAGAADSRTVLYSTTARTDKAIRLIGRVRSTQATAGTWATAPSEIALFTANEEQLPYSEVYVAGGNGHGAVNTRVRRLVDVKRNVGDSITYADSANEGASFTINKEGLYFVMYRDESTAGNIELGILHNGSALTTVPSGQSYATGIRSWTNTSGANSGYVCSTTLHCFPGDVIRPNTSGANVTNEINCFFQVIKVG